MVLKWLSMQKWQCPIHNGTLKAFNWSSLSSWLFLLIYKHAFNLYTFCFQAALSFKNIDIYYLKLEEKIIFFSNCGNFLLLVKYSVMSSIAFQLCWVHSSRSLQRDLKEFKRFSRDFNKVQLDEELKRAENFRMDKL